VEARQRLYVDGIGGQIGAWEKMEPFAQIKFDHLFVWRRESQLLIGRLWASSDGKKRTRYPMIVCAHCVGVPLGVVLEIIPEAFEELRARIIAAVSAAEVRTTIDEFRAAFREWMSRLAEAPPTQPSDCGPFLREIDFASEAGAMAKALFLVRESAFGAGRHRDRGDVAPAHFRLLASSASTARSLQFWERALASQLDHSVPLLLIAPLDQYWLDAIAGAPGTGELFCLRASPRVVGLSSEYAADPPELFLETARKTLELAATGEPMEPADGEARSWMSRIFSR
jgi:hypothetical protein